MFTCSTAAALQLLFLRPSVLLRHTVTSNNNRIESTISSATVGVECSQWPGVLRALFLSKSTKNTSQNLIEPAFAAAEYMHLHTHIYAHTSYTLRHLCVRWLLLHTGDCCCCCQQCRCTDGPARPAIQCVGAASQQLLQQKPSDYSSLYMAKV